MMVSVAAQQLVTAPVVESSPVTVDTEGDNLLVKVTDSGRVVLPLREARPLIEDVPLDYGTTHSKALVRDKRSPVLEDLGEEPKYSFLQPTEDVSSWSISGAGTLLLSLMVVCVLVGVAAAARALVGRHQTKDTGVLTA